MEDVMFKVCSNGAIVTQIFYSANLTMTTREEAIASFTETWDKSVEPMREKLTEISRQRKADGNDINEAVLEFSEL